MGRARNSHQLAVATRRDATALGDPYAQFVAQHVDIHYVTSDADVRKLARDLRALAPAHVSLDLETASNNGRWGARNGHISVMQFGVDEPDRGIAPAQYLIDCHRADATPMLDIVQDRSVQKFIQFMDFEVEWFRVHHGVNVANIYDTCIAWQVIQRKLKSLDPAHAAELVPGWEPHDNKLGTLAERYAGVPIPKDNQASDWSRRPLSAGQVMYAAVDVAVLPPLVAATRAVSARLGLDADIDSRTRWVKSKLHRRLGAAPPPDDSGRVIAALSRARSAQELERVRVAARQMTVDAANAQRVREQYDERLRAVGG